MADEPAQAASDSLAPSEVDQLLAPAAEPAPRFVRADGRTADGSAPPRVEAYDFRNPTFLSEGELRRLHLLHEDFLRYLSARLSLFLRMEFGLKLAKLAPLAYAPFTESLPSPTHLCLFKAEPLAGVGLLALSPRLALTIADRLLGGRGHAVKADRPLTEIEVALLEDILLLVLEEWCAQWKTEQDLRPVILGHEHSGRFLQTSPKDATVLALTLEVGFGDCSEPMQLGVPYYMIEPLVRLRQARRQQEAAVARPPEKTGSWQVAYERIALPVRAEWEAFDLTLREVASLRVGDVIELPAELLQETRVLFNGAPKFVGTVGLDAGRIAVQLTRKLPPAEEPAPSLAQHGRKNT
jgi:flagellar motor switch protein FliM